MKIQFASDLHLEVSENVDWLREHPIVPVGDVLVLAGDVTVLGREVEGFDELVDWCSEHFEHTFIVPGNHEYYGGHDIAETMHGWELKVRNNVSMMNNKSVVVDDVEFFFSTLWAQVPRESYDMVNKYMPECSLAVLDGTPLHADRYTQLHTVCRQWLDGALARSQAARKVVVTHHCPVRREDPRYDSNGLSDAFVNAMEEYVEASGVDAWIFGHTHYNGANGDILGHTRLGSNQLGYAVQEVCVGYVEDAVIQA